MHDHPRTNRAWSLCAALALCAACAPDGAAPRPARAPGEAGPRLVAADSVRLQQPDDEYIGRILALAIAPDGGFLVADALDQRVVRHSRAGDPIATYGAPGRGPGELEWPAGIVTSGDTLLVVADAPAGQFELFDLRTRRHVGMIALDFYVRNPVLHGTTLWHGGEEHATRTGIGRVPLADSGQRRRMLRWPAEYDRSPLLAQRYSASIFTLWGDTLLATLAGTPVWYVMDTLGTVRDTVVIPAVRRRGISPDFVQRLDRIRSQEEQFQLGSVAFSVHRLSSGDVAVVHVEPRLEPGLRVRMHAWVSVLAADRRRACVDAPLPVSQDEAPRMAWRGDTLFVAEQVADSHDAHVLVRAVTLDTTGCAWVDTWRGTPYTDWVAERRGG